ncbi:MAG: DNA mismatch repair protein MutL, partial [Desulfobacterales bacterium]|nr:DNA mismatch repair protein MutL [Desulfobacterales bacterium]
VVEGGKIKAVNQTGAPVGTMVSAGSLFYNTPARRKFLKTVNTEMGHITETFACIALSRPDTGMRLVHNSKTVKDWPKAADPFERAADVLGSDLESLLYPVENDTGESRISGWIADPSVTRSGTSRIYVFVNGRFIRDRAVIYALCEGFRGRLMKGRFPVAVLFLEVPPAEVDVNVHPAKQEVRFLKQQQVIESVRRAVESAWSSARTGHFRQPGKQPAPPWEKPSFVPRQEKTTTDSVSEKESGYLPLKDPDRTNKSGDLPSGQHKPSPRARDELFKCSFFSEALVIGQFKNTYIICEKSGELLIVDQHAAHERILYERLCKIRQSEKSGSVQRLLMPETVELKFREAPAMEQLLPELNTMGFEIEHFGGETFVVKAVPAELAELEATSLITDIADTAENLGAKPDISGLLDQCIILMSCHGAIRANQALTENEMAALLKQLDACENPFNCPHGRPTMIAWSLQFLEKSFKRL